MLIWLVVLFLSFYNNKKLINFIYIALLQQLKCIMRSGITFMMLHDLFCSLDLAMCIFLHPGGPAAFSPGNLSTSSSASSTLGSPDNDEYILSFETIDKMRRVSSYSSLNSLIGKGLSVVLKLFSKCATRPVLHNNA